MELTPFTPTTQKWSCQGGKIRDELIPIIRGNTQTVPDDIEHYAKKLERREKYMESILFFQVAAFFYLSECSPQEGVAGVTVCCEGL